MFAGGDGISVFQSEDQRLWLERMASRGWTAPSWPRKNMVEAVLGREQSKILKEELARIHARPPLMSFGISMLGPALLKFGSEELKQQHLPPIIRGEIRWAQGYSEPNAGSDLASLQARCEDMGDHYLSDRFQGLDILWRPGRLDVLPGPHRFRSEKTRRHQFRDVRHVITWHINSANPTDQWQVTIYRDHPR